MRKFVFMVFILFYSVLSAQEETKKINQLIDNYANTLHSNRDSALLYITKAMHESQKINDAFLLSRCYYNLGNFYYLNNEIEWSKKYTAEAIRQATSVNNSKILALGYNQLGLIEMDRNNYGESFKKLIKSLEIAQRSHLSQNECLILNNLALLFEMQKDTVKALEYYKKNEKVALENNFQDVLLMTYNNIATLKKKSNKHLAVFYLHKAYALAVDSKDDNEMFNILINLSAVYLAIGEEHKITKAHGFLTEAERLALKMKSNDKLFFVYFNMGGYYYNLRNYETAGNYYKKALLLSKGKGIGAEQKINLYEAIALTYKKARKFEQAFDYQQKSFFTKDSIFSLEKNKAFNEIQTKYEVEKKNLRINLLLKEKQLEKNTKRLYLYCGIILFIALFTIVLFLKSRIKSQKIIRQKENEIYEQEKLRQKQEQELKRILGVTQGEDKERNRIAKEIHDGIGGKLAGLKLNLEQINSEVKSNEIQRIIKQLSLVFKELRMISHNLSSNNIENTKLSVLVFKLLHEYKMRKEFEFEITIYPENMLDELDFEIKHQIYRIIQELVSNISKHSNAINVEISFTMHEDFLNIIVQDDGDGFSKINNPGIGLRNIDERLSVIHGKITIESEPNKGTTIIIDIPNRQK